MKTSARLVVLLFLAPAALSGPGDTEDLSGIWLGKTAGLVIHEQAEASFVGHPTDMKGTASITWNFYRLGESRYRFWVIVHGKGSESKFAECEITIAGESMTLPISNARGQPGTMEFERAFVRIPSEIAGVKISFRSPRKDDVSPDQYVERGLETAFTSAVTAAKAACPDLRRVLISATAGTRAFGGKHHRRDRRTGLCIGAVNGVSLLECGVGVGEAARRVKDGVYPVPKKEAYTLAAVTLLACLSVQEEVEHLHSPDLLGRTGAGFTAWVLENRWRKLPGSLSLSADLAGTLEGRGEEGPERQVQRPDSGGREGPETEDSSEEGVRREVRPRIDSRCCRPPSAAERQEDGGSFFQDTRRTRPRHRARRRDREPPGSAAAACGDAPEGVPRGPS